MGYGERGVTKGSDDDLEQYTRQLEQVRAALASDPTSTELLRLRNDLEELIALASELQAQRPQATAAPASEGRRRSTQSQSKSYSTSRSQSPPQPRSQSHAQTNKSLNAEAHAQAHAQVHAHAATSRKWIYPENNASATQTKYTYVPAVGDIVQVDTRGRRPTRARVCAFSDALGVTVRLLGPNNENTGVDIVVPSADVTYIPDAIGASIGHGSYSLNKIAVNEVAGGRGGTAAAVAAAAAAATASLPAITAALLSAPIKRSVAAAGAGVVVVSDGILGKGNSYMSGSDPGKGSYSNSNVSSNSSSNSSYSSNAAISTTTASSISSSSDGGNNNNRSSETRRKKRNFRPPGATAAKREKHEAKVKQIERAHQVAQQSWLSFAGGKSGGRASGSSSSSSSSGYPPASASGAAAKRRGIASSLKPVPILAKKSIFATADNPHARVGVTGSGNKMTEFGDRGRHKFYDEDE